MYEESDAIREKEGLIAPNLEVFGRQSPQFSDLVCARALGNATAISCIKVRQAGFNDNMHCDEMLRKWFKKCQEEKLPPASGRQLEAVSSNSGVRKKILADIHRAD